MLDESLPCKLKGELGAFEVRTVPEVGLAGVKNGALLKAIEGHFDVFVTADKNLEYQQDLSRLIVAVVVLNSRRTDIKTLLPLMPKLREVLVNVQLGSVQRVG